MILSRILSSEVGSILSVTLHLVYLNSCLTFHKHGFAVTYKTAQLYRILLDISVELFPEKNISSFDNLFP